MMGTTGTSTPELPTRALLWVSLLQGACLYFLYGSAEAARWPATDPVWFFPMTTLTVIAPLMLLLSVTPANWRRVARDIGLFSVVLALLAMYVGSQSEPYAELSLASVTTLYVLTIGIASFKAAVHVQRRAEGVGFSYASLFINSWRSFLVGALGGLFTLVFYLILALWGALFDVIGIGFFRDLFHEHWFVIPSLTFAFGLGVLLFRRHARIIDSITSILHSLMKLLLPLVVFVAAAFLSALPFTGLEPLWSTGRGTALLLWLLAVLLFSVNAVYQDGRETEPYAPMLHTVISAVICTTPIIAALSFYGLFLRFREYGWTVERCWAFVTWLMLALFSAGYTAGVLRRRHGWTQALGSTNTIVGLIMLVVLLLANSPLLDFRKISLASQIHRVDSGEIELAEFDFRYVKQHLARPGYLYLERLKAEIGDDDPDLLEAIENPIWRIGRSVDPEVFWEQVQLRPKNLDIPPELREAIDALPMYALTGEVLLMPADLDDDGVDEYVLIQLWQDDHGIASAYLFYQEGSAWLHRGLAFQHYRGEEILQTLLQGEITLHDRRFQDLDIGGIRFSVTPHRRSIMDAAAPGPQWLAR